MAIARYTDSGGGGGGTGKKATYSSNNADRWAQKYTPYKPPQKQDYLMWLDANGKNKSTWNQSTLNTQQVWGNKYGASGSTQNTLVPRTQAQDQQFYARNYGPNWAQSQQTPKPVVPPNAYNIPQGKPFTYIPVQTSWNNPYSAYWAGQQWGGNPQLTNMPGQYGASYPGYVPQKWPTIDNWANVQQNTNNYNAAKTILQKQQQSAYDKWITRNREMRTHFSGEARTRADGYNYFMPGGGYVPESMNAGYNNASPNNGGGSGFGNSYGYGGYGGYGNYGGGGYSYAQNAPEWWLSMTTWRV